MKKSIKIFSILLIIFAILFNVYGIAFASDVNMNLVDYSGSSEVETTNNNTDNTNNSNNTNSDMLEDEDSYIDINEGSIDASGIDSIEEEGLSFSNVLSILLITVGVILILLAIAIILRLK